VKFVWKGFGLGIWPNPHDGQNKFPSLFMAVSVILDDCKIHKSLDGIKCGGIVGDK
jgi:hypothetical protein